MRDHDQILLERAYTAKILNEQNEFVSQYDELLQRAAKLPWDSKPKVKRNLRLNSTEYIGEIDGHKVQFAVQQPTRGANYNVFMGISIAPPNSFKYSYAYNESGEDILKNAYSRDGISEEIQQANIKDFKEALDALENKRLKESLAFTINKKMKKTINKIIK